MYNKYYDTNDIRNPNYCVTNYIQEYFQKGFTCLDLGCGNCRKILSLSEKVKCYYAVDYDKKRIAAAQKLCKNTNNIILGVSDNFYLPFANNTMDIITSFMTKFSLCEVYRILKRNGILIIETQGANDKYTIKKAFGKDNLGWRGKMLCDTPEQQIKHLINTLSKFFYIEKLLKIKFNTQIKSNMLIELFSMTNDIRNFSKFKDDKIIYSLEDKNGYVNFNEERLIIVCKKMDNY